MTIASEITRIKDNIANAYASASGKGATLPTVQNSENLASCIDSIIGGGGGGASDRFGLDGLVGQVDENGVLQAPTGADLIFTGVTGFTNNAMDTILRNNASIRNVTFPDVVTLSGDDVLKLAFGYSQITSLNFPNLETVDSGNRIFQSVCASGSNLQSARFPKLKTLKGSDIFRTAFEYSAITSFDFSSLESIDGSGTLYGCFKFCKNLTTANLSKLYIIGSSDKTNSMFSGCTSLQEVDLSSLKYVDGYMTETFYNCTSLTKISFPSLERVSLYGFQNIFSGCTALTEIHFRADVQSDIEGLYGYADKFGATNATIYFDL